MSSFTSSSKQARVSTPEPGGQAGRRRILAWLLRGSLAVAAPYALVMFLDVVVLPADFFTFRCWEALKVMRPMPWMPGPFYPLQVLRRKEEGDLGHGTPYALSRDVVWMTDAYGYRKRGTALGRPWMVIVGDSAIAGANLDQPDLLSEVLERDLGGEVYPYAPQDMANFAHDVRFRQSPPRVVVLGYMERNLRRIMPIAETATETMGNRRWVVWLAHHGILRWAAVSLDRAIKMNAYHWARSRLAWARSKVSVALGADPDWRSFLHGSMLFYQAPQTWMDVKDEEIEKIAAVLLSYQLALRQRGVEFVFLPIPNKETVYYEELGWPEPPPFIDRLAERMRRLGVPVVDLAAAYRGERMRGPGLLYDPDDLHWNKEGVQTAAHALVRVLEDAGLMKPGVKVEYRGNEQMQDLNPWPWP